MKVKIKLFATLRNYGPEEQEAELPEGATLEDAVALLALPGHIPLLRIVNGEHRDAKYRLKEGDVIAFFPPIAGGQGDDDQTLLPFRTSIERNALSYGATDAISLCEPALRGLPSTRTCRHSRQKASG